MKKVIAYLLTIAMTASIAVAGTVAYLTSEDSDVNVMTLGNVKIEQHEQQLAEDGTTFEPFEQAKAVYPININNTTPGSTISKIVTVENTGKTDAYFRTLIAFEHIESDTFGFGFHIFKNPDGSFNNDYSWGFANVVEIEVGGVKYDVWEACYNVVLPAGETSSASLTNVWLKETCTNEDMEALGGTYEILVLSQAVQTEGFEDAKTALDTAFGELNAENAAEWFGGVNVPTLVSTADELRTALEAGGDVVLTADVKLDADDTITVAAGKDVSLNLNGNTIDATAGDTGSNRELFLVKGDMTVTNGTIKLTATQNQGWNAMATIFDVTDGGVLNLDGVSMEVYGTDMTFGVHLNNWGEVTLNMNDCAITTNYGAVRVFNSGNDMNNVTITNSKLTGASNSFWVHNYTAADFGSQEKADAHADLLNLNVFNGTNEFNGRIRYGMTNSITMDESGNPITG